MCHGVMLKLNQGLKPNFQYLMTLIWSEKSYFSSHFQGLAGFEKLTERNDDRTGDAVGHDYSEDVHQPGICCPELELIRLILCSKSQIN